MKTIKNLCLLFGSIAVTLIVAELFLRLFLASPPVWRHPQETYVFDPEMGHRLVQNQHSFTHDKIVITNSQGIRDREYPLRKSNRIRRILALGDSQTFGTGLKLADTWPKQLESKLNRNCKSFQWQVINGGIAGSSTWQQLILLERLAPLYAPEFILLGVYPNDIIPQVKPTPQNMPAISPITKRMIYRLRRSLVFLVGQRGYRMLYRRISKNPDHTAESHMLAGKQTSYVQRGWSQFEQSLTRIRAKSAEVGAQFALVILPRRDQVRRQNRVEDFNERIRQISVARGVEYFDPLSSLRKQYIEQGEALFIPWDSHNSAKTNAVIAELVAGEWTHIQADCRATP